MGFNWPIGHDNSVAVILDGKLVFASEEERYTRHKHARGEAPFNAFKNAFYYLKKEFDILPTDVRFFATNHDPYAYAFGMYINTLRYTLKSAKNNNVNLSMLDTAKILFSGQWIKTARIFLNHIYKELGYSMAKESKIIPVNHHLAHASSAYYFSGYKNRTAVITIDGIGENNATCLWDVKDGDFERVLNMELKEGSVGLLYESMSKLVGYNNLEGPGKLMGLSPYKIRNNKVLNHYERYIKILDSGDIPYTFNFKPIRACRNDWDVCIKAHDQLALKLSNKVKWDKNGRVNIQAANVSYLIQHITERILLSIARWAKENVSSNNVAMAGGVALNAKANMELYYSKLFNDVFVVPAANDAGGPIGAAAYVYEHVLGNTMKNGELEDVYLGQVYNDSRINKVVRDSNFKFEYIGKDVGTVAELIAKGKVVTWYQGRSEVGPRALGNRSILANPAKKEMWAKLNKIKGREWWRPLAPSLLCNEKNKYFIHSKDHRFMTIMAKLLDNAKERVPAICHVDNTARPQMVHKNCNTTYYNMIDALKHITGEGIVINTSFNLAGEPLVETPEDAMRSFSSGGFDAMYMQGWLITRS